MIYRFLGGHCLTDLKCTSPNIYPIYIDRPSNFLNLIMRRIIKNYENIMIKKILACKTPFEVLAIIDRKITFIQKKTNDARIIHQFINNSLTNLKNIHESTTEAEQFAKIRSAIGHLQNLMMRYKVI